MHVCIVVPYLERDSLDAAFFMRKDALITKRSLACYYRPFEQYKRMR